ncbi:hypothetical protein TrST_g1492 [Triparma strigata]|uniref:Major facilitator superfamily (MFS) profile domain-containing protein n=1 Tax=Triparma strigata TaxID=1606541 RepID=A0A9W7AFP2_9STRA|nr:hypothetical protein TrST_g1492 [Triparma strigata]
MSFPEEKAPSKNIGRYMRYTALIFAARSLWSQSVLASYIYLLTDNSSEAVGNVTGLMGLAQVLMSVPSGILSDKYRRDTVLRASLFVGFTALTLIIIAVISDSFSLLCVGVSVYGAFYGLAYTAGEALLSDSIVSGERSKILTRKNQFMNAGTCLGPLTAIAMFYFLGNDWTVSDCSFVILAGQGLCIPAFFLLCSLSDDHSAKNEEDEEKDLLKDVTRDSTDTDTDNDNGTSARSSSTTTSSPYSRRVPLIIALSDLISGLASGMSIRFFPIFFLDNLDLSPITVQVLYVLSPLAIVFLSKQAQKISKKYGRCQITVFFKWIGISNMMLMILAYKHDLGTPLILTFYLLRTTTMNCTSALTKSQLYDYVKKKERGRFTVLESVNMFSWSGSAALGGVLVERIGIINNFIVTGSLQFVATIPLLFLFGLPSEVEQRDRRVSVGSNGLSKPLLDDDEEDIEGDKP